MFFPLIGLIGLAGCGPRSGSGSPASRAVSPPSATLGSGSPPAGRNAVAADYRWFDQDRDLTQGFCFTWVKDLIPRQVITRLSALELERIDWQQLVGSGDGQRAPETRSYFGVARVDNWSLLVEDNGRLGATDAVANTLSEGTTVVSHYRRADAHGRFLLLEDQEIQLDFDPLAPYRPTGYRATELRPDLAAAGFDLTGDPVDPARATAAAFALTERLTTIPMTLDLLRTKTYLLSSVPNP